MQVATLGKAISNSDWITDEGVEIKKEDLPQLPGYYVLVKPVSIKKKLRAVLFFLTQLGTILLILLQ
jgi:hypothetical protein